MKVRENLNKSTLRIPLAVAALLLIIGATAGVSFARSPSDSSAGDRATDLSVKSGKASINTGIELTATATATPCVVYNIVGSITTGDPTQTNRLFRDGVPDTCQAPGTCGSPLIGTFHYDTYTYTNTSNQQICITVDINTACTGTNFIYSGAYLNSFNPANICQNWVADAGSSPNPTGNYSFNVPANTLFVINVHEVAANAGCSSYSLTVTGLPGGSGCPTVTPAPATATATTCGVYSAVGALNSDDPLQIGRLNRDNPGTCLLNPCPGMMDTLPRRYDAYRFSNSSSSTQCINVTLSTVGCAGSNAPAGAGFADSAGYLGALLDGQSTFNPLDLCTNYRGDIGLTQTFTSTYSLIVGPLEPFTIIVNEQDPNQGCARYTLDVRGCGIAIVTPTPCAVTFSDVPPGSTFYTFIRCLACRGIISGYSDGTFRPNSEVTRGQLAKIVSNAAGFSEDPGTQIFEDVPLSNPFYQWINRLAGRGIMSGYSCGGPSEPCVPPTNRPYFRWGANATRGQTSKIVSNAAGFNEPVSGQNFEDVPSSYTFYEWIQRLASRNIMSGYSCGGPGEPCVPPQNRHYFRPSNNVTRGQSAKIVANTFFPDCNP